MSRLVLYDAPKVAVGIDGVIFCAGYALYRVVLTES